MRRGALTTAWIVIVLLGGCNFPGPQPAEPTALPPTPMPPAATATPPPEPSPTLESATPTSEATAPPVSGAQPAEAILILEPGPASRVTSPVHIAGLADPTFEQTLVVRVLLVDGTEVATTPVTIAADAGQRGPFETDMFLNVPGGGNIFIQVFSQSARDGGTTHLASVAVVLGQGGPAMVVPGRPHPDDINIEQPSSGQTISAGMLHVQGIALASFEQTLLIELHDADGNVIASQSVIVNAPDLGEPGPFSADIPYSVSAPGPGRVVVRDLSPAFGGDVHLASVEVDLNP